MDTHFQECCKELPSEYLPRKLFYAVALRKDNCVEIRFLNTPVPMDVRIELKDNKTIQIRWRTLGQTQRTITLVHNGQSIDAHDKQHNPAALSRAGNIDLTQGNTFVEMMLRSNVLPVHPADQTPWH